MQSLFDYYPGNPYCYSLDTLYNWYWRFNDKNKRFKKIIGVKLNVILRKQMHSVIGTGNQKSEH